MITIGWKTGEQIKTDYPFDRISSTNENPKWKLTNVWIFINFCKWGFPIENATNADEWCTLSRLNRSGLIRIAFIYYCTLILNLSLLLWAKGMVYNRILGVAFLSKTFNILMVDRNLVVSPIQVIVWPCHADNGNCKLDQAGHQKYSQTLVTHFHGWCKICCGSSKCLCCTVLCNNDNRLNRMIILSLKNHMLRWSWFVRSFHCFQILNKVKCNLLGSTWLICCHWEVDAHSSKFPPYFPVKLQ